jgi:5-formyltetrahydrofolate cyclo-ligase
MWWSKKSWTRCFSEYFCVPPNFLRFVLNPFEIMNKTTQRTDLKTRRNQLSEAEQHKYSENITEHLFQRQVWQTARTVHCYCSFGSEVATAQIIASALREGKQVIVPVTPPHSYTLLHTIVSSETLFKPDYNGIPTPTDDIVHLVNPASHLTSEDCILVPLLGFDEQCHRVGYGKGYYDRFLTEILASIPSIQTIGLAFEIQRVELVITEAHDVPLCEIITEQRSIVRASADRLARS